MDLTLTVTEAPEDVNMINHTKAFSAEGGSLGRADKNTWVLPDNDRVVSSTHATISFKNDQFLVTDTSTNGTFHNDNEQPIGSKNITPLSSGDTLRIGNYKIKVSIKSDQNALGKGLQSADFLDDGDKTTFSAAVKTEQESLAQVKQLDSFLDQPSAQHKPENTNNSLLGNNDSLQGWTETKPQSSGFSSVPQAHNSIPGNSDQLSQDPLKHLDTSSSAPSNNTLDPMSQWDQSTPQLSNSSNWQDNDDAWWMDSSQADNATALSHVIPNETLRSPSTTEDVVSPSLPSNNGVGNQSNLRGTAHETHAPLNTSAHESITGDNYKIPHTQNPHTHQTLKDQWGAGEPLSAPEAEYPQPSVSSPTNNHSPQANTHLTAAGSHHETAPTHMNQSAQPQEAIVRPNASPQALYSAPSQLPPGAEHQAMAQHSATPQQHIAEQPTSAVQNPQSQVAQQSLGATQTGYETQTTTAASTILAQALGLGDLPHQQLSQLETEASGIINETINRLIDLLRARTNIKNELRVQRTMIQATDNNPLKFSASASEAMRLMFSPGNHSYLSPNEAVQDSFDDLSDHQVAVLAGMRAAYDAMLKHFAPENLDRRFKNPKGVLSNKKAKNWEDFQEHYANLLRDGESTYDMLFGEEFGSSYEKQLSELKSARSLTKTH